jgi:hypothetical protein
MEYPCAFLISWVNVVHGYFTHLYNVVRHVSGCPLTVNFPVISQEFFQATIRKRMF